MACAVLLLALSARPARADGTPPGRYPFRPLSADDPLSTVSALVMAQDPSGALWVGTDAGIVYYRGPHAYRFLPTEGLPSLYVTQLAQGHDGNLWCVTALGLALWRDERWSAPNDAQPGLALDAVRTLAVDARGYALVTTSRGLLREGADGQFALDPSPAVEDADALFVAGDGSEWVAGRGVVRVRRPDGSEERWANGVPKERARRIAVDGQGRIWLTSASRLFVRIRDDEPFASWGSFDRVDVVPYVDHSGMPWFAAETGLFVAEPDGARREVEGLPIRRLVGVFEDREGTIWVVGEGTYRLAGRGLWRSHTTQSGLPDDTIWNVRRTSDGVVWVGTQRGLARSSADGWRAVAGVPELPVRGIVPAPDGKLWLCGAPGQVSSYDPEGDHVVTFGAVDGVPPVRTLSLALDHAGDVWVGTQGAGLVRGRAGEHGVRFEPVLLAGTSRDETVRDLVEDDEGRMWVASDRGLFIGDGPDRVHLTRTSGLRADAVSYILLRRGGEACVAYTLAHGLSCFRFDGRAISEVRHLDSSNGLTSDVVYSLGEDAGGRLWIGSPRGAQIASGATVAHLTEVDGLPHHDCDGRAFWADTNGDVWLGTSKGLGQFFGSRDRGVLAPPAVLLEATHPGPGRAVALRDGASLAYADNAIEFDFAAATFVHDASMIYEMRLEGLEGELHETREQRVRYAVTPGSYTFHVRARRSDGPWGPPASLRLSVRPPWWGTWWFRASVFALAVALIGALVRARGRVLLRRNVELEHLVATRTGELSRALEEVARAEKLSALGRMLAQLSHELNNPINVVANNIAPLREYLATIAASLRGYRDASAALPDGGAMLAAGWSAAEIDFVLDDADQAVSVMHTAADRVRAIQLDLQMFLSGVVAPNAPLDVNAELRETVHMMARALPPGVRIDERYGAVPAVLGARGRLHQVFLNLLQNARDAVGERGVIQVTTSCRGGSVCVDFRDSGTGVPAEVRDRIFEPFFTTKEIGKGTGLGLAICRQIIVEQHGGTLATIAPLEGGAIFALTLPGVEGGALGDAGPHAASCHPDVAASSGE